MPEGCMTDVMAQCDGFNEVFIQSQKPADGTGNFRYQLNMENTMGDVVILDQVKNLGFVNIAGICTRVKYYIHIQGKGLTIVGFKMRLLLSSDSLSAFCSQR